MDKLLPLDISFLQNCDDIIEFCYDVYKQTIFNKDRPLLFDHKIIVPAEPWIKNKSERFWHVISMEDKEKCYEILPCNNDVSGISCNSNCNEKKYQVALSGLKIRNICYYRATRVHWILEIINLANNGDSKVKIWEKIDSKTKKTKLQLRYQNGHYDYIVVFEIKSNGNYVLLTGFPIFYTNAKITYDQEYRNYTGR